MRARANWDLHQALAREAKASLQAQSELDAVAAGLAREHPSENKDQASAPSCSRRTWSETSARAALQRAVNGVSGNMVMFGEQSMEDIIDGSLGARRFTRLVLAVSAGLALLLAAVGIYGVMAYVVSRSVHEIGVRQALGADRQRVLAMVLGGAVRLAVAGIAIGGAGAAVATRVLRGLLFGVTTDDPATFASVSLMLLLLTLIAAGIPAWRASRVDPIVALRYE